MGLSLRKHNVTCLKLLQPLQKPFYLEVVCDPASCILVSRKGNVGQGIRGFGHDKGMKKLWNDVNLGLYQPNVYTMCISVTPSS